MTQQKSSTHTDDDTPNLTERGMPTPEQVREYREQATFLPPHAIAAEAVCAFFENNECVAPLESPQHQVTAQKLLHAINAAITFQNEQITAYNFEYLVEDRMESDKSNVSQKKLIIEKTRKIPLIPQYNELPTDAIAAAIRRTHHIISICPSMTSSDPDLDVLAVYDDRDVEDSPTAGLYVTDQRTIRRIARMFNTTLTDKDFQQITSQLLDNAPRCPRATNPDLVAVNNGVFNFAKKKLEPFSPDTIFLTKSPINYVENAQNPVITHPVDGTTWDVESWMQDIAGTDIDPTEQVGVYDRTGVAELLWEIASACIRPYVSWNKSAWLFNQAGNNGKGTYLALLRNMVGKGNYASIPLSDFSRDFMLEPLVNSSSILVDENDVGQYLQATANLKAVITNDVIAINRKYRAPIAWQHYGFMVQCLNDKPGIRDTSESFFRRQVFVPFVKSYTGVERKYIKDEYINRQDVLEYVLHRVLHMEHYSLSSPPAVVEALNDYRSEVDPIRDFWQSFEHELVWDFVPGEFLYDVFKAWYANVNPNGHAMSSRKFTRQLYEVITTTSTTWTVPTSAQRPGKNMSHPEPLITHYELSQWANTAAKPGSNTYNIPTNLRNQYRGIVRI